MLPLRAAARSGAGANRYVNSRPWAWHRYFPAAWQGATLPHVGRVVITGLLLMGWQPSMGRSGGSGASTASYGSPQIAQIHMITASTGWAVDSISVLRTTDGARTWHVVSPLGFRALVGFKDYQFLGGASAWIVAMQSRPGSVLLLHTRDGGRTWRHDHLIVAKQPQFTPEFAWISFLNYQQGWLSTLNAGMHETIQTLFRTLNTGRYWTAVGQRLPVSHLSGFLSQRIGLGWRQEGGGSRADTYRTVDGGTTWQREGLGLPRGYNRDNSALQLGNVVSGNHGKATLPAVVWSLKSGHSSLIAYRTNDWGRHWQLGRPLDFRSSTSSVSYDFQSSSHGWAITRAGLYATTDAGKGWRMLKSNLKFEPGMQLDFVSSTVGFVLPELRQYPTQQLFKTVDGGRRWTHLYPKTQ